MVLHPALEREQLSTELGMLDLTGLGNNVEFGAELISDLSHWWR
jgi:hypothetical protein